MLVSNVSTLILLAKATLLQKFLDHFKVTIPDKVLDEVTQDRNAFDAKLIQKVMTDKNEKVADLLTDLNLKLDNFKGDDELIKEYTSQIEEVLDKIEEPELFLIENLGSIDFDKIKSSWQEYKASKIEMKEFIKQGIKVLGKKFLKLFLTQYKV